LALFSRAWISGEQRCAGRPLSLQVPAGCLCQEEWPARALSHCFLRVLATGTLFLHCWFRFPFFFHFDIKGRKNKALFVLLCSVQRAALSPRQTLVGRTSPRRSWEARASGSDGEGRRHCHERPQGCIAPDDAEGAPEAGDAGERVAASLLGPVSRFFTSKGAEARAHKRLAFQAVRPPRSYARSCSRRGPELYIAGPPALYASA